MSIMRSTREYAFRLKDDPARVMAVVRDGPKDRGGTWEGGACQFGTFFGVASQIDHRRMRTYRHEGFHS